MTKSLLQPHQLGFYVDEVVTLSINDTATATVSREEHDRIEIRYGPCRVVCVYSRRKDKYHPRWRMWTSGAIGLEDVPNMCTALRIATEILTNGLPPDSSASPPRITEQSEWLPGDPV